ncbi:hypothetical protein [Bacillus sp. M6-12]|uniref:YqgU-like beta propeller domain-containing protein n=1 Tax=Bacillus sp. M6-12 TaxID=2054166 RepID=UPI0011588209|nr:hypothetical protein [Bacillus sp. M6-12]
MTGEIGVQKANSKNESQELIEPVKLKSAVFDRFIGWTSNTTAIFITKETENHSFEVREYDIWNGKENVLYSKKNPIITVSISPRKSFLLIHTSSSPEKADIEIISRDGHSLYGASISSSEISFEWNMNDEEKLLVTSFFEDWTFTNYLLNAKQKTIVPINIPKPFAQWSGPDEFLFMDINKNQQHMEGKLLKKKLYGNEVHEVVKSIIQYRKLNKNLMIIQLDQDKTSLEYKLIGDSGNTQLLFQKPLTWNNDEPIIPYWEIVEKKRTLLTFLSGDSGEELTNLVSFDWNSKQQTVIVENAENAPLQCNPDGNLCLYGYQLEKIIDLHAKKVFDMVEARKDG